MSKLGKPLGSAIRIRRQELGLSQETLSELSAVHWTYISQLENGHKSPSLRVMEDLAEALQIEVSTLSQMAEKLRT
ncbi:MAG: helix-turn-helix transcriptional regulator [Chloroflexi bacterium]|nr:helix-turn-helix transcriptional regulator [Chloroflexota bacterium]MCY4247201.1 helix-turn-helix transcriptional regulator [Chloroflexota bacterium]